MIPTNACPSHLTTGACQTTGCSLRHDISVRVCAHCNIKFPSQQHFTNHKRSPAHVSAVRLQHSPPTIPTQHRFCEYCSTIIHQNSWNSHSRSAGHHRKMRIASWRLERGQTEQNRGEVVVDGDTNFGVMAASIAAGSVTRRLVAKTAGNARFTFMDATITPNTPFRAILPKARVISKEKSVGVDIHFTHASIGRYAVRLEMTFRREDSQKTFMIARNLSAIVGDPVDHTAFASTEPYVRRTASTREKETKVIDSGEPAPQGTIPYKKDRKLSRSAIPATLGPMLAQGTTQAIVTQLTNNFMPATFNEASHGQYFKKLLWVEEISLEKDIARYDMTGVLLTPHSSHYWLTVPGLAEKRPSVMLGDSINVHKQGTAEGLWFQGRVKEVQQMRVDLKFHGKFNATAASPCDVHFKMNRIPLQRQHGALETANVPSRVLFPTQAQILTPVSIVNPTQYANSLVESNPRQRLAVTAVLSQPRGSVPFVVFGPPGTGKTVTIVECINQILKRHPNTHILACAPSNSAADVITDRLRGNFDNTKLFRMYAPSRNRIEVPPTLLPYTYQNQSAPGSPFSIQSLEKLKTFRIIVATCVASSMLYGVGFDTGHFSHIFIDEAGQGTEPEAMVPIRTLVGDGTNVVLSGDPKQLGPIIRSDVARAFGLDRSYLERLMDIATVYDPAAGLGRTVVKLTWNFRSHEAILRFPNIRFYEQELEARGNSNVINRFIGADILVNPKFPIVFYAIPGQDQREASSPSFFNIEEVTAVKEYVTRLKAMHIVDGDIGVVSPYRAQTQKIRQALRTFASDVKVGSTEEFQGQERLVMIISTVRSSQEFLEYDLRHTLGFVSNPRRFNVAVTRAKALLLVVGDPNVLSIDPLWRSFLNYIHGNQAWRGAPISWDPAAPVDQNGDFYAQQRRQTAEQELNNFTTRFQAMSTDDDDGQEDQPPVGPSE